MTELCDFEMLRRVGELLKALWEYELPEKEQLFQISALIRAALAKLQGYTRIYMFSALSMLAMLD